MRSTRDGFPAPERHIQPSQTQAIHGRLDGVGRVRALKKEPLLAGGCLSHLKLAALFVAPCSGLTHWCWGLRRCHGSLKRVRGQYGRSREFLALYGLGTRSLFHLTPLLREPLKLTLLFIGVIGFESGASRWRCLCYCHLRLRLRLDHPGHGINLSRWNHGPRRL